MLLADAYLRSGALDRAATVLRDGLSRWPHHLAARVSLARVLLEIAELEQAETEIEAVLETEPEHWGALDLLATLKRQQGDRRGEVAVLCTLQRLAPGRREVERRLESARRDLQERMAVPAKTPSAELPPPPDTVPTVGPRTLLGKPVRRVETVPSARSPFRLTSNQRTTPGGPLPGVPRSSCPPPAEDPFFNETMVDLLVAQGRMSEARELLDKLAGKRPGRSSVQERLAELRSGAEGGENPATNNELEELMQGVLSAAAQELDALTRPVPTPPVRGES